MARVVVIGGGYGGVTVAKGLDPLAEVILIEQKDQFVHHAAALRAAVDTVWEHAIFMPYTNLLSRGQVVRGTVSAVDGATVHVFGHDPIEADYIVFATGSTYPFPAKYSSYRSSVAKARLEQLHENLSRARSVMIVGGGTVGIELTGELASAFPGLDIMIVESSDVGDLAHFMVETKNGDVIEADLWFQCYGARANTGFLIGSEYESVMHPDGTLRVEPTMQVAGHSTVYAVGDLTDVRESKRADAARQQARVVIANITAQIEGEAPDAHYVPTKEWVILPLGPNMGASQLLDSDGQTRILGAEQTAEIKGTDLMVSVIRSQLNLP